MPVQTLVTATAALAVVLAMILLAARAARLPWLRRRTVGSASATRLTLETTLALDRVRRLHVVRCDGRDLMLLTGGTADLVVGWLPNPGQYGTGDRA